MATGAPAAAVAPAPEATPTAAALAAFGEGVPYGDPSWYTGRPSPYYNESHAAWRAKVRAFVEEHIAPHAHEWDENREIPKELYRKMGAAGVLPGFCGAFPTGYVPARMEPPGWDGFHTLIAVDELSRAGSGGVVWGIVGGMGIGLPPVLRFGSEEMKARVAPRVLAGEAVICLAITEPMGGSDVANLRTSADKDDANKCYLLNGSKKWITNAIFADYIVVAARTGGPGMWGVSLLLVERNMPGVTCKKMDCMGVWASGTTYVEFDNVKVPYENLIGPEVSGEPAAAVAPRSAPGSACADGAAVPPHTRPSPPLRPPSPPTPHPPIPHKHTHAFPPNLSSPPKILRPPPPPRRTAASCASCQTSTTSAWASSSRRCASRASAWRSRSSTP